MKEIIDFIEENVDGRTLSTKAMATMENMDIMAMAQSRSR